MKRIVGAAVTLGGLLLMAGPSFAHHSVGTEFDVKNCRDFTGTLTKLSWQNPHAYFFMDVKDASGKVQSWSFQTFSTLTLKRAGTDRQEFLENMGKDVWVRGCLARSGAEHKAAAGTLKFSDGRLRQVGQLQDGAPAARTLRGGVEDGAQQ
jgi:hypothetical protein